MTNEEIKYINFKKFCDELEKYKADQQRKGVMSNIVPSFAKKKKVCLLTIYRRQKFVREYEQRTGRNSTLEGCN